MQKIFMMIKIGISVNLIFICGVFYSEWSKWFCTSFFCCAFFNITVIAEVFIFQISESRTDWDGPNALQNISTLSYFFISKCHTLTLHYSNLTRRIFWYFLGFTVYQAHRTNAGIKAQLSFLWNFAVVWVSWCVIEQKWKVSPILRNWVLTLKFN